MRARMITIGIWAITLGCGGHAPPPAAAPTPAVEPAPPPPPSCDPAEPRACTERAERLRIDRAELPPECVGDPLCVSKLVASTGPAPHATEAQELLVAACGVQYLPACSELGEMLAHGEAGPADLDRAQTLWQLACGGGDPLACYYVGQRELAAQAPDAALHLRVACAGGIVEACAPPR